jgi:HD-like signal output (HDOD) protein
MLTSSQEDLTIADLLRGDLQLASPPNIYFELKKTLNDPTKSMSDAAFVIEKDAALALRLMKIVNSAFYGFPSSITSIPRAITLIGTQELQSLVLGTIVIERFSNLPGVNISMHDFWAINLKCALISKELDASLGRQYSDSVFLCGLFHDIGQLVLFRRFPVLAREVNLLLQAKQEINTEHEVEIEEQVIGFNHYQVGAELCRLWQIPEVIIESINLHCFPDHTGQYCTIASIARLANYYSKLDISHDPIIANSLEISDSEMVEIIDKAYDQFEEVFNLFYSTV